MVTRSLLGFFTIWLALVSSFGVALTPQSVQAEDTPLAGAGYYWTDDSRSGIEVIPTTVAGEGKGTLRKETNLNQNLLQGTGQRSQALPAGQTYYKGDITIGNTTQTYLVAVTNAGAISAWYLGVKFCQEAGINGGEPAIIGPEQDGDCAESGWLANGSNTAIRSPWAYQLTGTTTYNASSFLGAVGSKLNWGGSFTQAHQQLVADTGKTIAAPRSASRLDDNTLLTKLGSAICQGRTALIDINKDLSNPDPNNPLWQKDEVQQGQTVDPTVRGGLQNPGQVIDGIVAYWNAVNDGGTYEKLTEAGKQKLQEADRHLSEAEQYYTELRKRVDAGTASFDPNNLKIDSCGGAGKTVITKLGAPGVDDGPGTVAYLLKRAKLEQKLVEEQPTSYGTCKQGAICSKLGQFEGTLKAVVDLICCLLEGMVVSMQETALKLITFAFSVLLQT